MNYKKINIENYLIYRQRHLNYFVRNNSLKIKIIKYFQETFQIGQY